MLGTMQETSRQPVSSDVYDEVSVAAPHPDLVVFGGQSWVNGEGRLLNDTWLWRPPLAIDSSH